MDNPEFLALPGGIPEVITSIQCGGEPIKYSTKWGKDELDSYGEECGGWTESGPEVAFRLHIPEGIHSFTATLTPDVSEGTLFPTVSPPDLDLFVLKEGCAAQKCQDGGKDKVSLNVESGKYYYLVVDGYLCAAGTFSLELECSMAYMYSSSGLSVCEDIDHCLELDVCGLICDDDCAMDNCEAKDVCTPWHKCCLPSCDYEDGGTRECGDDGCGGSCGTCAAGRKCVDGWCGGCGPCGEEVLLNPPL